MARKWKNNNNEKSVDRDICFKNKNQTIKETYKIDPLLQKCNVMRYERKNKTVQLKRATVDWTNTNSEECQIESEKCSQEEGRRRDATVGLVMEVDSHWDKMNMEEVLQ